MPWITHKHWNPYPQRPQQCITLWQRMDLAVPWLLRRETLRRQDGILKSRALPGIPQTDKPRAAPGSGSPRQALELSGLLGAEQRRNPGKCCYDRQDCSQNAQNIGGGLGFAHAPTRDGMNVFHFCSFPFPLNSVTPPARIRAASARLSIIRSALRVNPPQTTPKQEGRP